MSSHRRQTPPLFPEEEPLDFQEPVERNLYPSQSSLSRNRHQRAPSAQEASFAGMYSGQLHSSNEWEMSVDHEALGASWNPDSAFRSEYSYEMPAEDHRVLHNNEYFDSGMDAYGADLAGTGSTNLLPSSYGAEALPSDGAASYLAVEDNPSISGYQTTQINISSSVPSGSDKHSTKKKKDKLYMLNPDDHPEKRGRILDAKRAMRNRGKKHDDELRLSRELKEVSEQLSSLRIEKERQEQRNLRLENLLSQLDSREGSQYDSHLMESSSYTGDHTYEGDGSD